MRFGCFTFLAALLAAVPASADEPATFPLKDGDIWVMAGDSITAQHLHSNYMEAFCYARYPKLKFAFRNSGVGGHTIPTTLARFEYDIAAWKPTIVSVELGMNDSGNTATDKFAANMDTMVKRIRSINARPVILTASPVNDGTTAAKNLGRNVRLAEYAVALKERAAKEKLPFADQFHALHDVWGKNKPRENLVNSIANLRGLANDETIAGAEHLKAFLAAQDKSPIKAVALQGDAVHPGPPGQLMMAAALLKDLGAEANVSSVTIDAPIAVSNATAAVKATGCTVTDVKAGGGSVSFDRLDECLPFPIPDDARSVLVIAPEVLALSKYTLAVTNIGQGNYILKIDGNNCGQFTAAELAAGINLTALPGVKGGNPIADQSRAILAAVSAKETLVTNWRGLSQRAHAAKADPKLKDELAALTPKVEEADAKIRDAAKPKKHHFEVVAAPAK
jgi:lysophospholipase L1-like esterase